MIYLTKRVIWFVSKCMYFILILTTIQLINNTMNLYLYKGTQTSHAPSGIRTHNPSTCHGHGSHQYDVHHQKSDYITRRVIWLTWSNMWYDWHGQKSDMTYMVKRVIWRTWSNMWFDLHGQKSDMTYIVKRVIWLTSAGRVIYHLYNQNSAIIYITKRFTRNVIWFK